MEAKVDVRKLQILNDRINQTIDALNQVRLSVHGLGHSGLQLQQMNPLGFMGQGYQGYGMQPGLGVQNPYLFGAQSPFQGIGGQLGQLSSQLGGQPGIQGFGAGLGFQHSPFLQYQNPFLNPFAAPPVINPVINPWLAGQAGIAGSPWGGLGGVAGGIGGGLFHSSPDIVDKQIAEVKASDPYRITQTFPFVIP
ncbi:MAG TPA: hypothetical protein VN972_01850 [Methylomirabilota bacterium]|nr:hypothetical protein [Methylomirabilota bacterium]